MQTIDDGFKELVKTALPDNLDENDLKGLRKIYFAGAICASKILTKSEGETQAEAEDRREELGKEILKFIVSLR